MRGFLFFALVLSVNGVRIHYNKRQDPSFDIKDLVDWESLKAASNFETLSQKDGQIAEDDIPADPLNPEDFRQADTVQDDLPFLGEDPILLGGYFEGDIANVNLTEIEGGSKFKNAIKDSWRKWPNGIVPYIISSTFSQYERGVIAKAMKEYHEKTCIRFRPRTSEKAYIHIMKGSGCSSSVGRTGSQQTVSLGNGCVYTGIVIHELMHAAGFWHEQSRADRDSYVVINWSNIMKGMEYNFLKYNLNKIDHLGASYDTCSVMHYGAYAFSKGRSPTIEAKKRGKCQLGQREGFSDTDIRKINTLYECKGYPQVGGSQEVVKPATTTAQPWVKPDCLDQNKYCATWAKMDECKKNPSWMLVYCPVACDQCKVKCEDSNVYCSDWAASGECSKNPDYMNIYCPKSCGICKGPCSDENNSCSGWASKGYCKGEYKDYMALRCKKSCGKC